MTEQRFKDSFYEAHARGGFIFFTGARLALGCQEFREFLINDIGISREEVEVVLKGCSKCWRDLGEKIGPAGIKAINDKIHELDRAGDLKRQSSGQVHSREFSDKKSALEFIENLKESDVSSFFVGYRL